MNEIERATYAGLTISDKPALLDAKNYGKWIAKDSSGILYAYRNEPIKKQATGEWYDMTWVSLEWIYISFIQWFDAEPVNIDLALAQIAEMESAAGNPATEILVSEKPMTWNERINQMTVEEKADIAVIISKRCSTALEKESCLDLTCWQCFIEFLNSPYTEGATK